MTSPTADIHDDKILILDFGSQYTQLIARRVRELGVYCEIHPISITEDSVKALSPRGVILSGGPESVTAQDTLAAPSFIFELGLPVLGICYGMQTMAQQLGGRVEAAEKHEFGHARVTLLQESLIFSGLEEGASELDVWMSHGDQVVEVPAGFAVLAKTGTCPVAAMSDESRQLYGLQFHPEVQHTPQGGEILDRFLKASCNCRGSWTPANIVEDIITNVRRQVGARNVILTDVNEYRLDLAKRIVPKVRPINVAKQEITRNFMESLGILEGFDVCLEMSGSPAAFQDVLSKMINGGSIAMLGIMPDETGIAWTDVVFKGLNIKGIYGREMYETWYKMVMMVQSGLPIERIITHRFHYTEFQEGFDIMRSGQSGKVILDWKA